MGPCLPNDQTLRPVKGQLSFGRLTTEPLAAHPVRDQGVYVPCFEDSTHPCGGRLWAMGSTYERGHTDTTVTAAGHDRNAASLAATLPDAHTLFQAQRASGELLGWAQVRCASPDRLPMAGALPDASALRASMKLGDVPRLSGAWTLCALGSRGLTLSKLGAELLAAQMENEPWPIEKSLGLALDPARFALKNTRKNAVKSPSSA
jgi:tRNA 5-methylaminomethyl-2-thiouridine biosynthesis bifunctional protein